MSPLIRRRAEKRPLRLAPYLSQALSEGAVELTRDPASAGDALRVAVVVPQFRRGSGGHKTIADLVRGLEARGHKLELLIVDEEDRHAGASDAQLEEQFHDFFGAMGAPVRRLGDPPSARGADVVLATGWQTVPTAMRIGDAAARAYLVQDHEPEFHPTSAERDWATWTYTQSLHAICASPWLAGLVRDRYGASASHFDLGVDHETYRALPTHRRHDLVLLYARATTPRRAVPLGVLALQELHARRPEIELALFGDSQELATPFPHRHLGVLTPEGLAHLYAEATVGVVLSLTNPSLVPTEMLACGLPVVDLATPSMLETFGIDGPIALAEATPRAIADRIEALVDDLVDRADRTRAGMELVAQRSWAGAAEQVETGLRQALQP